MSDRITKDELTDKLKDECFNSFRLRMAINGIKWLTDEEVKKNQMLMAAKLA